MGEDEPEDKKEGPVKTDGEDPTSTDPPQQEEPLYANTAELAELSEATEIDSMLTAIESNLGETEKIAAAEKEEEKTSIERAKANEKAIKSARKEKEKENRSNVKEALGKMRILQKKKEILLNQKKSSFLKGKDILQLSNELITVFTKKGEITPFFEDFSEEEAALKSLMKYFKNLEKGIAVEEGLIKEMEGIFQDSPVSKEAFEDVFDILNETVVSSIEEMTAEQREAQKNLFSSFGEKLKVAFKEREEQEKTERKKEGSLTQEEKKKEKKEDKEKRMAEEKENKEIRRQEKALEKEFKALTQEWEENTDQKSRSEIGLRREKLEEKVQNFEKEQQEREKKKKEQADREIGKSEQEEKEAEGIKEKKGFWEGAVHSLEQEVSALEKKVGPIGPVEKRTLRA